jgi:hypothetical protein
MMDISANAVVAEESPLNKAAAGNKPVTGNGLDVEQRPKQVHLSNSSATAERTADDGNRPQGKIKGYLAEQVEDAEVLLKYAAGCGLEIDKETQTAVLEARFEADDGITEPTAANLLFALTRLTSKVYPVTATRLKIRAQTGDRETRFYMRMAVILMALIIPYSIAAFVTAGLSDKIGQDITVANALAVKLSDLLEPAQGDYSGPRGLVKALPPEVSLKDVITDLQLFASTIRTIDGHAKLLSFVVPKTSSDRLAGFRGDPEAMRDKLELPRGLPDIPQAANDKIHVYQDIRYFAQNNREVASLFYGAIANHVLPMLYALLGSCAYLARNLELQLKEGTFAVADRHVVHFLIAGIGGLIVGLFTGFSTGQTTTLSPLGIAFLAGYAVDVFFSFLENLIQMFNKGGIDRPAKSFARTR